MIVSDTLASAVTKLDIIESGINLSDHLPLPMALEQPSGATEVTDRNNLNKQMASLRWDKADLFQYYSNTYNNLSSINVPTHSCYGNEEAVDADQAARQQTDSCYRDIVVRLRSAAIGCVPLKENNFYKFWWDTELDMLKEESVRTNKILVAAGKPHFGPIF